MSQTVQTMEFFGYSLPTGYLFLLLGTILCFSLKIIYGLNMVSLSLSSYSPPRRSFSSKQGKRGGRKIHAFVRAIVETSPWFPQQWRQVGRKMREAGEPIEVLKLWQLVDQVLQNPTEGIELLLNEGSEMQEELWQGSQASNYCNEQVRRKSKKDLESQEAYGGEKEAEEGTSPPREMPRIYPGHTRLANSTIKDESPPRYRPLVLPKFPPVKKSPSFST